MIRDILIPGTLLQVHPEIPLSFLEMVCFIQMSSSDLRGYSAATPCQANYSAPVSRIFLGVGSVPRERKVFPVQLVRTDSMFTLHFGRCFSYWGVFSLVWSSLCTGVPGSC